MQQGSRIHESHVTFTGNKVEQGEKLGLGLYKDVMVTRNGILRRKWIDFENHFEVKFEIQ